MGTAVVNRTLAKPEYGPIGLPSSRLWAILGPARSACLHPNNPGASRNLDSRLLLSAVAIIQKRASQVGLVSK